MISVICYELSISNLVYIKVNSKLRYSNLVLMELYMVYAVHCVVDFIDCQTLFASLAKMNNVICRSQYCYKLTTLDKGFY